MALKHKKWEYGKVGIKSNESFTQGLTQLGEDGWEAFHVVHETYASEHGVENVSVVYLKRPKE